MASNSLGGSTLMVCSHGHDSWAFDRRASKTTTGSREPSDVGVDDHEEGPHVLRHGVQRCRGVVSRFPWLVLWSFGVGECKQSHTLLCLSMWPIYLSILATLLPTFCVVVPGVGRRSHPYWNVSLKAFLWVRNGHFYVKKLCIRTFIPVFFLDLWAWLLLYESSLCSSFHVKSGPLGLWARLNDWKALYKKTYCFNSFHVCESKTAHQGPIITDRLPL